MGESGHTSADGQLRWLDSQAAPPARRMWHAASGVALALAVTLAAIVVTSQMSRPPAPVYRVTSGSMEPTLAIGQVVHIDPSAYASVAPRIGDIVVVHAPAGAIGETPACGVARAMSELCPQSTPAESDQIYVKRVVAAPGETVAVLHGWVVRDGVRQLEPFATMCDSGAACNFPAAITVPAGEWFLMGDDRERSDDSRYWGPVPKAWIVGKVIE